MSARGGGLLGRCSAACGRLMGPRLEEGDGCAGESTLGVSPGHSTQRVLTQEELSRHADGAQCGGLSFTPFSCQRSWWHGGGLPGVQQHQSLA